MNLDEKVNKYNLELLSLTNSNESNMIGGKSKYLCNPKKNYKEICNFNSNGKFNSKEQCLNECTKEYINIQLKKANIYKESLKFFFFIKDLIIKENMSIYIKGGNVIGLAVLKIIYDKFSNDDIKFKKIFNNFLKLELIKDWDFTAYTNNKEIDEKYRNKLDNLANEFKLVPRAKTFVLYQTKIPILIYNKALFEIAILDSESIEYSKMEIPLTTMKVRIDQHNLKYIFMLSKSFYSWTTKKEAIDLDILKNILSEINIIYNPHKFGLYNSKKLDTGELNSDIVNFINHFTNNNTLWSQFLITQLEDPYRIIYRMPEKNIKKTSLIIDFLKKNIPEIEKPQWLLNVYKTNYVINNFLNKLSKKLVNIYQQTNSFDKVLNFLDGVNFGKPQIQVEWNEFNKETKKRLVNIFEPLVNKMGIDLLKKKYKFR